MTIRETFESWYRSEYTIRGGARGRASRHLEMYEGDYVSDHARECYVVWMAAMRSVK